MLLYMVDVAAEMTLETAIQVARAYDKYDFPKGKKLCDSVLTKYFEGLPDEEKKLELDVDFVVAAVVASFEANLESAYQKGNEYIKQKLSFPEDDDPFGPAMFNRNHIGALVPVLVDMKEKDPTFELLPFNPQPDIGEIQQSLFPAHLAAMWALAFHCTWLTGSIQQVFVSVSNLEEVNGHFDLMRGQGGNLYYGSDRTLSFQGSLDQGKVEIFSSNGHAWTIALRSTDGQTTEPLYVAPYANYSPLPPVHGWRPVSNRATGNPRIKHLR